MSAIFISHSSADNAWAERIRDWLRDEQQQRPVEHRFRSMFLDFDPDDGIHPAERWRDTLFERLQLCAAVIVICSEAYAASQWCLAELGIAMAQGKLLLPVRIDASPLPKLLIETQSTTLAVIDLEKGSPAGWHRLQNGLAPLSWQARLPWPPADKPDASPFPGLVCFEREHAPVFFGQDAVLKKVQEALERLTASESRLLLILGASGCGKSSLLRAGVVPWLAEADRRRWIVLDPFRPEDDPFGWLSAAIAKAYGTLEQPAPAEPARTAAALHGQLRGLRRHAQQQDAKVVLAIDQFEELLGRGGSSTDPGAAGEADTFLTMLGELLALENSRVVILATLRSDFFGILQLHPCGLHRLAGELIQLGPMDQAGFRQVIEGPARRVGLGLETGLSDQLVHDTATGDALPLLAFTLSELWRERPAAGGLTLQQHRHFGGLAGAVKKKADEVLATSAPTEMERAALREAFLDHLVRLSEEGMAAKRPARWGDLPAASQRILRRFVDARLLVSGKGETRDTVEIAHEALLRTWPTLLDWISEGRLELEQRRRMERLCEELDPSCQSEAKARQDAIEQLARMAALGAGASEGRAVAKVAGPELERLVTNGALLEAERADGALVLALIGEEEPLRQLLADGTAPVGLRRRAAESLGLLASRCGNPKQRLRIAQELEGWLRAEVVDVLVEDERGWDLVDAVLPLLQGSARGLQLANSRELPLLGSGAGRVVPMLTLTALNQAEGEGLQVRSEVVEVPVWRLPLPQGEQLELVVVPAGEYGIGSPEGETGRNQYHRIRERCDGVNVEAERRVRLESFAMARFPISQAQWQAVAGLPSIERDLNPTPGSFKPDGLWECHAQLGNLPVDNVSWVHCRVWLARLNHWLSEQWVDLGVSGEAPQLALPSESRWEVACRAGSCTPFHFGNTLDPGWAKFDGGYTYGRGRRGIYRQRPTAIGAFGLVNRWGLAEMHGQLWEWCGDRWHPDPIGAGWPDDGRAWEEPDPALLGSGQQVHRLLRGGSWIYVPHFARAAARGSGRPRDAYVGAVRPVCFSPPGLLLGP